MNIKPLLPQRDLLTLLPILLGGYVVLFLVMLLGSPTGEAPTLTQFLGNLALLFWSWVTLFVVNTVLYRIEVRNAR